MAKTSLRLMFMNLENLFSPGVVFYQSSYTEEEYRAKIRWIAATIARAGAHVVAMSELGEDADACLGDLMQAVNDIDITGWGPFQHAFSGEPSKGGAPIRTAIMSRFPLQDTQSLVRFPPGFQVDLHQPGTDSNDLNNWLRVPLDEYSRPVTRATVCPPNVKPFHVFVVHLKSKRPIKHWHDDWNEAIGIARAAIKRNVEAAALRYYLDQFLPAQFEADPKIPTFVVGDFNDTPTSVPVENIRGPFDKNPGPGKSWTAVDKRRLVSCARLHLKFQAYEDRLFSYIHNESFTLIDQAFVTLHLVSRFRGMEVYNDHVFRHQHLSAATAQEQQWKSFVSDHGAVVVEFVRMLKP
ncbi:MAG: hypothetical protein D6802_06540 [Ardenticatenia bacterium]|nr:MAG: hypothetical protein D6802_06540 [Ardenticatenia bacterium]